MLGDDIVKMKLKKYLVCYIMTVPILCLWMRWYQHIVLDSRNADLLSGNGFYVFARNTGRFGIIFFLVWIIQFLVCRLQKFYSISILTLFLLLFEVFQVPGIIAYCYSGLLPIVKAMFREGAIITCLCILICIVIRFLEAYRYIKRKDEEL